MGKKAYSFLQQTAVFAIIVPIADGLAFISPIPMLVSVTDMVLLFIGLCTKVVKLGQTEGPGNSLSTIIIFSFVPSGISLINSLGIMQQSGAQIVFVILVAALALLAATGWTDASLLYMKDVRKEKEPAATKKAKGEARVRTRMLVLLSHQPYSVQALGCLKKVEVFSYLRHYSL